MYSCASAGNASGENELGTCLDPDFEFFFVLHRGFVVQLGARFLDMEAVVGSIPRARNIRLPDGWILNKNTRAQNGQNRPMIRFCFLVQRH
jgi:hypothetical protein